MTDSLYQPQRNWGARHRVVTYYGIQMVILENEQLRIGVLAGKGTDIIELNYKARDLDFAWLTPGGVRNPLVFAQTAPDARAAFRDNYPGGWQEVFPNGGNSSSFYGADYGQHGEVFNVPWDVEIVADTEQTVAVRFSVRTRKSPFLLEKTITLHSGEPAFEIEERLVNESSVAMRAMWGHHITFGPPFLKPGHRVRLPEGITVIPHPEEVAPGGRRVSNADPFAWPIDPVNDVDFGEIPHRGTPSDVLYLAGFQPDDAWYEIADPDSGVGARVEWDAEVMPYLWFWQEFGAHHGYPWYGRNFNIGLEPFSSMPSYGLAEAVKSDSAMNIEPAQEYGFQLRFSVIEGTLG